MDKEITASEIEEARDYALAFKHYVQVAICDAALGETRDAGEYNDATRTELGLIHKISYLDQNEAREICHEWIIGPHTVSEALRAHGIRLSSDE